ncbi:hypothetical protein Goshw_023602 [Gossypium schwendimanii]|uniref:DUF4283 domain-containing protein n=1 Tax=Gossypium schwendimanii TaxID=34291 RepID=A0A7J9LCH8_GOSSC|nr:hypothetical protein [Gossypium schwendimanii]
MRRTMVNLWHPVKGVQISDLGGKRFLFRFFLKMDMDQYVAMRGRRRGLRGDNLGDRVQNKDYGMGGKKESRTRIDPMLGLNLEGDLKLELDMKGDASKIQGQSDMEHNSEECAIVGGDGKKRPRRDSGNCSKGNTPRSLVAFFMVTKINSVRMEILRRCGFLNGIKIAADGSRGWLCLAWKENVPALVRWATSIRYKRVTCKKELIKKLEEIMKRVRDDENLVELIDVKIHLNLEINKDETTTFKIFSRQTRSGM